MKKILSLVLCFLLALGLVGCGKTDEAPSSSVEQNNEIEQTVKQGKFDICDYGLGADAEAIKDYYKQLADDYDEAMENHDEEEEGHDHSSDPDFAYYNLSKKQGYTVIETADVRFYCTDKGEKGIAAMATDSAVFGFTPAITTKYEVEEVIPLEGETVNADDKDLKLLAVPTDSVIILRYVIEEYQLDFYFYENSLITTVILDTENWEI